MLGLKESVLVVVLYFVLMSQGVPPVDTFSNIRFNSLTFVILLPDVVFIKIFVNLQVTKCIQIVEIK